MRLAQLYAMRLLIDALIEEVEQEARPVPDGSCPHPAERQVDATTLGGAPQIMCLVCGQQRAGSLAT